MKSVVESFDQDAGDWGEHRLVSQLPMDNPVRQAFENIEVEYEFCQFPYLLKRQYFNDNYLSPTKVKAFLTRTIIGVYNKGKCEYFLKNKDVHGQVNWEPYQKSLPFDLDQKGDFFIRKWSMYL